MAKPNRTTLVLTNKEALGLVPMADCIELLHEAYADFGNRNAQVIPRRRRLILAAAVAAMVLAIPALALILKLTQVFERFAV